MDYFSMDVLLRIIAAIAILGLVDMMIRACDTFILKPKRLRSRLAKQGIRGPPASFLLGNSHEIKAQHHTKPVVLEGDHGQEAPIVHDYASSLFPCFERWTKEYGPTFMFSLGNMQCLHMNGADVVKEMSICISLDFGKPSYQRKMLGPLLGHGVLTANGRNWVRQRKIVAGEFTVDKIKGMTNLIVECAMKVVNTWSGLVEKEGGVADVTIEKYLSSFSGDSISRACFGSNYSKGQEIFSKIRALEGKMAKRIKYYGIPIMGYIPTKNNRETWRLENEVRQLILKVVKERKEAGNQNDLLQKILEGAENSDLGRDAIDNFIVDNCKNIYLAGYETTSLSSGWALMLMASNPEWQDKARAEVLEICAGKFPDADMLRKMKILTMVINEAIRLYPTSPILSREAIEDLKFGDIVVPKGVVMWTSVATMMQDPEIWGPDAHIFNPGRFANGAKGACKLPSAYQPFGIGPRICLGQHFATAELKILLSLLLSNFSFSLSPSYKHSPVEKLIIQPQYGVKLLIRKH